MSGDNTSNATSVSVIDGLKRMDSLVWDEFYISYQPMIAGWLRRKGVDDHDAEDIVQDVLSKVHGTIVNFEHNGNRGAFRKWLRTVTLNRLKTHHRRANSREKNLGDELGWLADQLSDPESDLAKEWDREHHAYLVKYCLRLALQRFPQTTLDRYERVYINGEPAAEVAAELGVSEESLRSSAYRIHQFLREFGEGFID